MYGDNESEYWVYPLRLLHIRETIEAASFPLSSMTYKPYIYDFDDRDELS